MNTPSPTSDPGHARRLLVMVVIATTAAAVTAGVALNERHAGEAVVQRAEASPANGTAATPAPEGYRRGQWPDPARRRAPLAESASTSIGDVPVADPSVPAAAEALKGVDDPGAVVSPTF